MEFALVLPALLLFLLGIMDMGRLAWTMVTLDYATSAAARCAAIDTTLCGTAAATQAFAVSSAFGMTVPTADFTVTSPSCGNQVVASFPFVFTTPWVTPTTITLTSSACYPTQVA